MIVCVFELLYLLYRFFLKSGGKLFKLSFELWSKSNVHGLGTKQEFTNITSQNLSFAYLTFGSQNSLYSFFLCEVLKCTSHNISAISTNTVRN